MDEENYSVFNFEIIFIGSSVNPEFNRCKMWEHSIYGFFVDTNIPKNIFRIDELSIEFKTFDNDTGLENTINMEFYYPGF